MKYLIFALAALHFVPLVAFLSSRPGWRPWFVGALFFSPVLAETLNINYFSMETYRGPDRGFEINLSDLLCWGLSLGLILKPNRRRWRLPFNTLPLTLYFGCALVSASVAPQPIFALFTLWKLLKLFLLYACLVHLLDGFRKLPFQTIALAMVGVGWLVGLIAMKQKYLGGYYRIQGPFDHSNTVPIFLLIMLPILWLWPLCGRHLSRGRAILVLSSPLLATFAVATTQSRAGLALSGLVLLGSLILANLIWRSRRTVSFSLAVFLLMVGGLIKASDTIIDRIQNAPKASEEARDEFNHAAQLMVQARPWTGVGLNSFSYVLTHTPEFNSHIVVMANEEQAGVAHHIYWLTAAEMGLPGLLAFLLCFGRWWMLATWQGIRKKGLENTYLLGYALGLLCFLTLGFLEWAFRISPVTYFVTVNMAVLSGLAEKAGLRK